MTDLYDLGPDPAEPNLPGETVVRESEDQLLDILVADIYLHALQCVQRFGDFHMALGAGPFYERLCRRLMTDPQVRQLPWQRTHLWAVCDRPDPDWGTRFSRVLDLLEDHSGIPDSHLHAVDFGEPNPGDAYERTIQEALAWREKGQDRLDLVVLDLERSGVVRGVCVDEDQAEKLYGFSGEIGGGDGIVSMTPRLMNSARLIALTAVGREYAHVVGCIEEYPSLPRPVGGTLRWYLDRAACSGKD